MITRGRGLCAARGVPLRVSATGSRQLLIGREDNKANQSIKKWFPFIKRLLSFMLADNTANQSIKKWFPARLQTPSVQEKHTIVFVFQ